MNQTISDFKRQPFVLDSASNDNESMLTLTNGFSTTKAPINDKNLVDLQNDELIWLSKVRKIHNDEKNKTLAIFNT
jgi:hypothetical protein